MSVRKVLDCTLRDGGYCNDWNFGSDNIKKITAGLCEANVDIIECGFLTNTVTYRPDCSRFTTVEQMIPMIPENRRGKLFVAMVNCGEYAAEDLPQWDGRSVDGIRVAFHKKDLDAALELCRGIRDKGYKVFVQAMVSLTYSDQEFLELIRRVNELSPYAFYIVDSFGSMKRKDLMRMFDLVEKNLQEQIWIGFHSHNNMQLSYSNAQALLDLPTDRNLILDSSVYGMGRGAGNLNTELIVDYINEKAGGSYQLPPLLTIIDDILSDFHQRNFWGFTLPNYLSAVHNVHPNYAAYLDDKKTLTVKEMNEIFRLMEEEKKVSFDRNYIEELYLRYMETGRAHQERRAELQETLRGKRVLLIAPGKSSGDEKEKIIALMEQEDVLSISVNFEYPHAPADYIFVSNLRRFRDLDEESYGRCIVTSNVGEDRVYLQTPYQELLTREEAVRDNAGLMAIGVLMGLGVEEVYLAGFDGYSYQADANYASRDLVLVTKKSLVDAMNRGMQTVMAMYAEKIKLHFVTMPKCWSGSRICRP